MYTITQLDVTGCGLYELSPLVFQLSSLVVLRASDNRLSQLPLSEPEAYKIPNVREVRPPVHYVQ